MDKWISCISKGNYQEWGRHRGSVCLEHLLCPLKYNKRRRWKEVRGWLMGNRDNRVLSLGNRGPMVKHLAILCKLSWEGTFSWGKGVWAFFMFSRGPFYKKLKDHCLEKGHIWLHRQRANGGTAYSKEGDDLRHQSGRGGFMGIWNGRRLFQEPMLIAQVCPHLPISMATTWPRGIIASQAATAPASQAMPPPPLLPFYSLFPCSI